jgi:hypothetical protein
MGKWIFKCDADAASDAWRNRHERFEALACHICKEIEDGIAKHNRHEAGHGFLPAMPEEISMSTASAVDMMLKHVEHSIERFIVSSSTQHGPPIGVQS